MVNIRGSKHFLPATMDGCSEASFHRGQEAASEFADACLSSCARLSSCRLAIGPPERRILEKIEGREGEVMLPGVELARRRRVHHGHEVQARDPQDLTAVRRPSALTAMDESAAIARQRLEEKLRRFSAAPLLSSPSSLSSPFSSLVASKARGESHFNQAGANNEAVLDGVGRQRPRKSEIKKKGSSKLEVCAVCLDVVEKKGVRLPCSHEYHSDCLRPWLASHSQCPSCRTYITS